MAIMDRKPPSTISERKRNISIFTRVSAQEKKDIETLMQVMHVKSFPALLKRMITNNHKRIVDYRAGIRKPPPTEIDDDFADIL